MASETVPENTQKMLTVILLLGFHSHTILTHTNKCYPSKQHPTAIGSLKVCLPMSFPTHILRRMTKAHKVLPSERPLISKLAFSY